jgi:hypothetical protein
MEYDHLIGKEEEKEKLEVEDAKGNAELEEKTDAKENKVEVISKKKEEDMSFEEWMIRRFNYPSPPKRPKPRDEMTDDDWLDFSKKHEEYEKSLQNEKTSLRDAWLLEFL